MDTCTWKKVRNLKNNEENLWNITYHTDPLNCDGCDLAWLIRDNRKLLDKIVKGACSNNTLLTSLNPSAYADCEVPTEPTTTPTESTMAASTSTVTPASTLSSALTSTLTSASSATVITESTLGQQTDTTTSENTTSSSTTISTTEGQTTALTLTTKESDGSAADHRYAPSTQLVICFWLTLLQIGVLD